MWTTGFWPRKAPIRAAKYAAGIFPQIRDADRDFRLPTVEEIRRIGSEFAVAADRADADIAIWSPLAEPSSDHVREYEEAGVTWWFANGEGVSPDSLLQRIEVGPPV